MISLSVGHAHSIYGTPFSYFRREPLECGAHPRAYLRQVWSTYFNGTFYFGDSMLDPQKYKSVSITLSNTRN